MEKINFKNLPSKETPINAQNLNKIQENTETALTELEETLKEFTINNKGITELVGTEATAINANDIEDIGVYKISGNKTNFDTNDDCILCVTYSDGKLVQGKFTTEGVIIRTATRMAFGAPGQDPVYFWEFGDWQLQGGTGSKEIAYENDTLEGTEAIMIEDSDFEGLDVITEKVNIVTGQEFETGRVVDGKKEYGKRINLGTLPNADTLIVNTGIPSTSIITKYDAMASGGGYVMTLPDVAPSNLNMMARITFEAISSVWNVKITTGIDRSNYTGYMEIYYTKNEEV